LFLLLKIQKRSF